MPLALSQVAASPVAGCSQSCRRVQHTSCSFLILLCVCVYTTLWRGSMDAKLVKVAEEEDEVFIQSLVWPEEDRLRMTGTKWTGGYRYFRSPNVVCIEH